MKNQTSSSLHAILKNYYLSLEQHLFTTFPNLKINRGLPRLYYNSNPSLNFLKKEFSDLISLKHLIFEKFILPLYQAPKESKICLFTYMLSDGWGDLIAHDEIAKILRTQYPNLTSIICAPKNFSFTRTQSLIVHYEKECMLSKEAFFIIQNSDLVLSIPTHYPHIEDLKKITKARLLQVGQYGFVESNDFSPTTQNYSMGLHFLELGVLTRTTQEKGDFRTIENRTLLYTLFGTTTPQTLDIEIYQASHSLYLAYLVSPIGGATYLHALLLSQLDSAKTIDICTPDIKWLISYLQTNPTINYNIQELEIHYDGKIHRRQILSKGKKVRIISPGPLTDADFRKMMLLSEEFVAVRGDQSFSEAISANRIFFYDGAPHARYFIKDLLALAENRLKHNPPTLSLFKAMGQAFAYNIPQETSEWVEETHFQEKEPIENIAQAIRAAIHSPQTLEGFQEFNQIVKQEYSCNNALCQLVARELTYQRYPEKEAYEKEQIRLFAQGHQSLKAALEKIKKSPHGS